MISSSSTEKIDLNASHVREGVSVGMRSQHCCSVLHVFVFTTADRGGRFLLRHGFQNTIHTIIIKLSARSLARSLSHTFSL